jgi:hypothetical protein
MTANTMASRNMVMIPLKNRFIDSRKKAGTRRPDQVSPISSGEPDHDVLMTLATNSARSEITAV